MAPISTDKFLAMEKSHSRESFVEGLAIVVKLLSNIIADPTNTKYRSFRLENKTIKDKVLSIVGMKDYLISIGFIEAAGSLILSDKVLIKDLRVTRDYIQSRHDNPLPVKAYSPNASPVPVPGPSKNIPPARPRYHGRYSGSPRVNLEPSNNSFIANINSLVRQVLSYEDKALQEFGRSLVPTEKLREETIKRLRMMQKKDPTRSDLVYEDVFLVVFTEWFNRCFFTWVNAVPCKVCGATTGTRQSPSYIENGIRVEEIFCCGQPSKFYRYNDIATLLVTRQVGDL